MPLRSLGRLKLSETSVAGHNLQVRLKRYIEMRGADGGPESHVLALPAFWVGLLYDDQAKAGVLELTRDWTLPEIETLRDDVRGNPSKSCCAMLDSICSP